MPYPPPPATMPPKSNVLCRFYSSNSCIAGASCRFSHALPSSSSSSSAPVVGRPPPAPAATASALILSEADIAASWASHVKSFPYNATIEQVLSISNSSPKAIGCATFLGTYQMSLRERGSAVASDTATFALSQLARQAASLASNRTKQSSLSAETKVVENNRMALSVALADDGPLSASSLCLWHAILFDGLDVSSPGCFRLVGVRVGDRQCCPASHVPSLTDKLVQKISSVMSRADLLPHAKAACATVLLLEVHPFADGNGRLARILCNWVLKECGYPFTVALGCAPPQRAAYTAAVLECRESRTVAPFCTFLVDVLTLAWEEFRELGRQSAKNREQSATVEAISAARAEAKLRGCGICLDENPNIATLCCGAPVHLNCLANWLTQAPNPSCANCREPMPRLPDRPHAPPAAGEDETGDDTTTFSEDDDTTSVVGGGAEDSTTEEDTTTYSEETTSDEDAPAPPPPRVPLPRCSCNNVAATGCVNGSCGRCCVRSGPHYCERHGS